MFDLFWGLKTIAAFDVWTFEHILSGLSVGAIAMRYSEKHLSKISNKSLKFHGSTLRYEIIFVLLLAFMWETMEHYLEVGIAGETIKYWFQGVEAWVNRFITDPLMLVLGYYLAKRFPFLVNPARIMSFVWLYVHVFIFPHSMYLHYLF